MISYLKLKKVKYLPKELEPGVLYFSKKFMTAGHLCPCGCGNKVITPVGPTDWSIKIKRGKPTLLPSIGNWQIPCKSHYWIEDGLIKWSGQWSEDKILAGRKKEEKLRISYYDGLYQKKNKSIFKRLLNWFYNGD
jgi:hypothetical protein